MRYLVTLFSSGQSESFFTNWFEPENHFCNDIFIIVYDLAKRKFTTDGKIWNDIEVDHL